MFYFRRLLVRKRPARERISPPYNLLLVEVITCAASRVRILAPKVRPKFLGLEIAAMNFWTNTQCYPVYMRGELYLGWSPILGKWCLVHLEPARVSSDIDFDNMGKVTRLAFYVGGKEIFSYSSEDLQKLGLERKVAHLTNNLTGSFTVHGIDQIPLTNHYVFAMERTVGNQTNTEKVLLDITTGKVLADDSRKK